MSAKTPPSRDAIQLRVSILREEDGDRDPWVPVWVMKGHRPEPKA